MTGPVTEEAAATLRRMLFGQLLTVAVGTAARLGIADLLADGPKDPAQIACECGAHPPSVRRLLRSLASFEVFVELPDGRFGLTLLAQALRQDVAGSMASIAALIGGGLHLRAWAEAIHSIRTGETALQHLYGVGAFDLFAKDPEEAEIFNRAMTENTARMAPELIETYDFSRFGTIVDVGGGQGLLLAEVLRAHPSVRGVLFDLPEVVAGAVPILDDAGVTDRCEVVGGSFFEKVPAGGDLYMMKAIIHDWDDERSSAILRNCRACMSASARVALIEQVMPERIIADEASQRATLMDLNMLVLAGGRERTQQEFADLFTVAGLRMASVEPTPSGANVIEGLPT